MKIAFVRLLVTDFEKMYLFYRDVLGFQASFGDAHDVYADFETEGVTLALFRRDLMAAAIGTMLEPSGGINAAQIAVIWEVADVDAAYQALTAKGVAFLTQPEDRSEWGIRTAHFTDPEGNLLEIYQPLSQIPQ